MANRPLPPVTRRNTLLRYCAYSGIAWAFHINLYDGTYEQVPLVFVCYFSALSLGVIAFLCWGLKAGVFTLGYFIRDLVIFGSMMGLGWTEGNLPVWLLNMLAILAMIMEYRLTRDQATPKTPEAAS